MPRVTRSKKIEVAEDHTASPIAPLPLPDDVVQPSSLSEMTSTNTMQDSIAAELKGLKAAYRSAVGGARKGGKRGRKQKKNNQEAGNEGDEEQDESLAVKTITAISTVPVTPSRLLQGRQVEGTKNQEEESQTQVPIRRNTRQQAAQAGQYGTFHFDDNQVGPLERSCEINFIATLFAGRSLYRSPGRVTANSPLAVEDKVSGSCKTMGINTDCKKDVHYNTPEQSSKINGMLGLEADAPSTLTASPSESRSRSPVKTLAEVEASLTKKESGDSTNDGKEDSFIEHIIACSPAKHVSRIEDSVEALDQMEEAIEALDQAALTEKMPSPEKTRRKVVSQRPQTFQTSLDSKALMGKHKAERDLKLRTTSQNTKTPLPSNTGYASVRVRPTAPRASVVKKATSMVFKQSSGDADSQDTKAATRSAPALSTSKRPVSMISNPSGMNTTRTTTLKRPVSWMPPKEIVKSAKPVTKSSFELPGEAISRKLKEQREARLALRESNEDSVHAARAVSVPKIRSTKPPTKSNFELPGEAVSRRKREANEARLKAQEEEERKRREFKAKPHRKSIAPNMIPRDTVASRARQSKVGLENIVGSGSGTIGIMSNIGAHRPSLSQLVSANTSAPRAPGPAQQLTRQSSVSANSAAVFRGSMQRTVSATEAMVQRQRAKEIYNRDVRLTEDIERERREREAAAKRAREEAAERGRQASREWAEKQMAKKLAGQDKNLGAGYGPGGQMGLKA